MVCARVETGSRMKVSVDEEACIGCELCSDNCPEVFHMTDGKARRVVAEIAEAVVDKCKESAESCPVDAITVDS